MPQELKNVIEETLKPLNISFQEFSEIIIRLLDYGMLNRSESLIESTLYDRYLQCAALVEDYLSVMHVALMHDTKS
jgi:transcriptional regulator CtsR